VSILSPGILAGGGSGGGSGGGIPEAPTDGKIYGRQNASWSPVETARYRHIQATNSVIWSIQHNLGSKPVSIFAFDSSGNSVIGEPDYVNSTINQINLVFSLPISGMAYVHTLL
jgi:hypothetical protein